MQGWSPTHVTIAPDDAVNANPDVFTGKLLIHLEEVPPEGAGERVTYDGREFWVRSGPEYGGDATMISTHIPGNAEGRLTVQYPDDTGWTQDAMLEFLASVQVGPGARPGLG